jgi:hypothetical protein
LILLVRAGRLELPRPYGQQILSLPRLPFRHARSSYSGLTCTLVASQAQISLICRADYRSDSLQSKRSRAHKGSTDYGRGES